MDDLSNYEYSGDERKLDLKSFMREKRLKEIRFMLKVLGYWTNSNVVLTKIELMINPSGEQLKLENFVSIYLEN